MKDVYSLYAYSPETEIVHIINMKSSTLPVFSTIVGKVSYKASNYST